MNLVLDHTKEQVINLIKKTENEELVQEVEDTFMSTNVVSPFADLDTEYRQSKFFSDNFGLVVSVNS